MHGDNIIETDKNKFEQKFNKNFAKNATRIKTITKGKQIEEIFAMGDFNDKFDFIKELKFTINNEEKTLSYFGNAPKSCCHNWDSSCDDNPRKYIDTKGKCPDPKPSGDQLFENNKLYADDKKTMVLPMTDGSKVADYKYAGDKVFGLIPTTNELQIFNNATSKLSIASDHELVYGYFQSSANTPSNLILNSNLAIVAVSTSSLSSSSTSSLSSVSPPAIVAVSNSISKLKFIKVIFKGIIPEDVELIEQIPSSYTSKGTLQEYIKTQLSNVSPSLDHEEYFVLTKDDKKLMEEIHNETMASNP